MCLQFAPFSREIIIIRSKNVTKSLRIQTKRAVSDLNSTPEGFLPSFIFRSDSPLWFSLKVDTAKVLVMFSLTYFPRRLLPFRRATFHVLESTVNKFILWRENKYRGFSVCVSRADIALYGARGEYLQYSVQRANVCWANIWHGFANSCYIKYTHTPTGDRIDSANHCLNFCDFFFTSIVKFDMECVHIDNVIRF